jgi:hypothetical protein
MAAISAGFDVLGANHPHQRSVNLISSRIAIESTWRHTSTLYCRFPCLPIPGGTSNGLSRNSYQMNKRRASKMQTPVSVDISMDMVRNSLTVCFYEADYLVYSGIVFLKSNNRNVYVGK